MDEEMRERMRRASLVAFNRHEEVILPRVSATYEAEKKKVRMRRRKEKRRKELLEELSSPPHIIPNLPFPVIPDCHHQEERPLSSLSSSTSTSYHHRPRNIRPGSLAAIRDTFVVQCERGRLKKPRIHVHFTYPRTPRQFCLCEGDTDFLFVFVGLLNIFVLQFVVVILLFFLDREITLSTFYHLDSYYYSA